MRTVLLVRHADAGVRGTWPGDDLDRELSPLGTAQARLLAELLPGYHDGPIASVASSRAVRCVDTVAPLAASLGLDVAAAPVLLEGEEPAAALAWLTGPDAPSVACSHGDVIGGVVTLLQDAGAVTGRASWPKAGTWVLRVDDGRVVAATPHGPPDVG